MHGRTFLGDVGWLALDWWLLSEYFTDLIKWWLKELRHYECMVTLRHVKSIEASNIGISL